MAKATRKLNLFLNEPTAEKLRMRLLLWRLEQFDGFDTFDTFDTLREGLEAVREKLPNADGRLIEKIYPLSTVSNAGRDSIMEYAADLVEREQFADETSVEAEVTQALVNCKPHVVKGVLSNADIKKQFNMNKEDREQWNTQSIVAIVRRLGFQKKRTTRGGRGYIYDVKRLANLCLRYGLINEPVKINHVLGKEGGPLQVSKASNLSNLSNEKDRIIYNIDASECALCKEVPEQLYPDANEEYWICKPCKLKEASMR